MAKTTDFTYFTNERPNYFPGQYLLEDDFELQHKYLSDRLLYHNQSLHLSGIIEGLEIVVIQDTKSVQINSGSALDNNGNLIVLKENLTFSTFNNIPDGELYIQYFQDEQNQQQKDVADSYTRWIEKPIVGFAATTPQNSVKLAKLAIKDTITVDVNLREYSGLSLPNPNSQALTLRSGGNANPNLAVLTGSLKIDGDLTVTGTISGTIDTKNITSGILSVDRIPELSSDKITSGILSVDRIPNLSADKITSGILSVDRIPNLSADKITSGILSVDRIPNLSTDKITSGILSVDRIPNLSTDKITSGILNVDRIPNLSADKITSGKISGNLTINGAFTPSVGNTETNGIMFPKDPYGGSGDAAWIRYYSRNPNSTDAGLKEQLTLEIGTSNDPQDHIALMPSGGVGIGINNPGDYKLNLLGNQYIKGSLTIQDGKVNINGNQQILFTDTDTTNNLKLQLWTGYGLGINSGTLFYTADGNHSWRDKLFNERMLLTTGADGGLTVKGTGTSSFAGNLTVTGNIVLSDYGKQIQLIKGVTSTGSIAWGAIRSNSYVGLQIGFPDSNFGGKLQIGTLSSGSTQGTDFIELMAIEANGNTSIKGNLTVTGSLSVGASVGSKVNIDLSGHVQLKEYGQDNIAYLQARDDSSNRNIGLRIRTQAQGTTQRTLVDAVTITPSGEIQGKIWYSDEYVWKNGQAPIKMGLSSKCIAFLTYVQGKFAGNGEQVFTYIGSDGYWYLGGNQGSGGADVVAKARCIGSPT